jgi:hypothetical protein
MIGIYGIIPIAFGYLQGLMAGLTNGLPSHPCSPILMPSLVGLLVSTIFSTRQDWRFSYWKKIDYRLMNVFNETFVYRDTDYRRGDTIGSRIHFMTRQNVDMAFSL